MTDLRLVEGGPPIVSEMDQAGVECLVRGGVVAAIPLGAGRWEMRAARKVGVVRIGSTTVWVKPKITIAKLLWLIGWSRRPVFVADGPIELAETSELVAALAEAFCVLAERALASDPIQGYREIESSETVLRGRLRSDDQRRQRFGLAVPLLVRYDDYLVDVAENQILRSAATTLLRLPGVDRGTQARLRKLRALLAEVSDLVPGTPLPSWQPTRLNSRYHDALGLAEIVWSGRALEQEAGSVRLDGFLIDLYQVFENFVTATLGSALERVAGRCQAQDRFSLDEEALINIRPDLVWRIGGRPVAVIDAKYKAETPAGFPQADLYQALAYGIAYSLPDVHLVYGAGNAVASSWQVRHARVRITAHALNLDTTSDNILAQVAEISEKIAAALSRMSVGAAAK